jgi:hypothetical protein
MTRATAHAGIEGKLPLGLTRLDATQREGLMNTRVLVAGLLGGLVFFIWGAISHMLLPIGEMGMKVAGNEDAVIAAAREGLRDEGVYIVPGMNPEKLRDPAAVQAYGEKAKANPYAFVVYQPQGKDFTNMGGNLVREWLTNTLSALLVAWVLSLGAFGFNRRVLIAGVLGLFAWSAVNLPYWNWYRFPLDFTIGSLLEQVIGWVLAGSVMAWWFRRSEVKA